MLATSTGMKSHNQSSLVSPASPAGNDAQEPKLKIGTRTSHDSIGAGFGRRPRAFRTTAARDLCTLGFAFAIYVFAGGVSHAEGEVGKDVPTQVLALKEWFGVTHPQQIVEFALDRPARPGSGALLGESGNPVSFQLLENGRKLAVRTGLKAHSNRTWRWFADRDSPVPAGSGVAVSRGEREWEISNEWTAVRIPLRESVLETRALPAPLVDIFNYGPGPRVRALAPIQGVRLRDGTWSGLGPNVLVVRALKLLDARVDVVEAGPLKAVVQVRYDFERPAYMYGQVKVAPPGPDYLLVTLTMLAGEASILVEEDTGLDEVWAMNLYEGLAPDQAQYQGHHSDDPKLGRMPDGSVYAQSDMRKHFRGEPDAIVDLQYRTPQVPSYVSSAETWRYMAVWDPWIANGGWYWQLYNSTASGDANLVSIFAGPVSRALSAGMSSASIFTLPSDARTPGKPVAGISSQSYRRAPDARIYPRSRFSWGIFLGVKEDLPAPGRVSTVNLQSNLLGGPVSLTKLAAMKLDFPDPPQGYGGMYMDKAALDDVIARVRQSTHGAAAFYGGGAFYRWLSNAEPSSRALFDAWADERGAKMRAAAADIERLAADLVDDLVNGPGIHSFRFHYWHGGLAMMRRGLWIDQVLASNQLSAEQRARVKAAAALFAYVLWDNDFVPMDNSDGFNMGNPNMPQQQQGYRYFYAQLLAAHPDFAARAGMVEHNVRAQVRQQINESGAHFGSPHYIGAAFAPTLNTLMQIKQLGKSDPFASESRLRAFADFYLNLLTPPEVRFPGRPRSQIALGDSSTEASPIYGQLGTAFRDVDPDLSRRLMGAWRASGSPHSGFFGTTVMMIDDRLPAQDARLGSATFPGYYSVLRTGWGTPHETAAWIVNGDFYRDHRSNDAGNIVLYALGVPISVHWGAIYLPQTRGAYYHSSVVLESEIDRPWNEPSPPPDTAIAQSWKATQTDFAIGKSVDTSISRFERNGIEWTRKLQLHHADPSLPVIAIRDDFKGSEASASKVSTFNLMARGPVRTARGSMMPELRTHPAAAKASDPNQLPSAGPVFSLNPGVSDLSFTGQFGVDFDVFVIAREPQEAFLGNWADTWTQQLGSKWEERQHILRIRGTGSFQLVIVPFRAGHRPADLKVEDGPNGPVLTANGRRIRVSQ
jgi:hypothetical protein